LVPALNYDPQTGAITWSVQEPVRGYYARTNKWLGHKTSEGYLRVKIAGRFMQAHVLAWRIQTGAWPEQIIDHRDRDRSNNRWGNLRQATPLQNLGNRSLNKNNTSGYRGVSWSKARSKWQARVGHKCVGYFDSKQAAYDAYLAAASATFGDYFDPTDGPAPRMGVGR